MLVVVKGRINNINPSTLRVEPYGNLYELYAKNEEGEEVTLCLYTTEKRAQDEIENIIIVASENKQLYTIKENNELSTILTLRKMFTPKEIEVLKELVIKGWAEYLSKGNDLECLSNTEDIDKLYISLNDKLSYSGKYREN